jgi:hypothetical protein
MKPGDHAVREQEFILANAAAGSWGDSREGRHRKSKLSIVWLSVARMRWSGAA